MLQFRDVVVAPYTELLQHWQGLSDHKGGPAWPDWDAQTAARHCRLGKPIDIAPEPAAPVATIDTPVGWGGAAVRHFGHQIGDFSARLLPTMRVLPGVPIAFASHPRFNIAPGPPPDWFWSILDWLGVPRDDVYFVSEPTLMRDLAVLPQSEQVGGPGPDASTLDMLDELVERRLGKITRTGTVYVLRASQVARFAAEDHLESALAASGVTVVRPEVMPLPDQLRLYASADVLIFAEGSALYGIQLLGRGLGDLVVLNRRPYHWYGEPSLAPRVRSLTHVDANAGLVHPLRPSGEPAEEYGVTLVDPTRLLEALSDFVPNLHRHLDADAYRRAQQEDILRWLAALNPSWTSSREAMDHLLKTIRDSGAMQGQ